MGITSAKPQVWQRWRAARRLSLLATFEDSSSGTRVKEFCQSLIQELGSQCRVFEHVWLFSTLRMRELRQIAAEEARASDLIIVSVQRSDELPGEVKDWIELWIRQNLKQPVVLLALLDPDYEGASTAVQSYLRDVAHRGHMEFLVLSRRVPAPP
jgi:hypothetical protein